MISLLRTSLLFFCVLLITKTWGQNTSREPKQLVNKYKWDVSLDMYNLMKTGDGLVMLRYKVKDEGAIRLKLGGSISSTDVNAIVDPLNPAVKIYTQKSDNFSSALGYEFHKNHKSMF
jgi:hypothetical protein